MPEIHQSTVAPYSAAQMFELVQNVEQYPAFLPWCEQAQILSRTSLSLYARLAVRKGRLHYRFTTENIALAPHQIELRLVNGPFKRLAGYWRFADHALGSRVSLDLDFEFSNPLLAATLSPLFKVVTGSMINAFKRRAAVIYG